MPSYLWGYQKLAIVRRKKGILAMAQAQAKQQPPLR